MDDQIEPTGEQAFPEGVPCGDHRRLDDNLTAETGWWDQQRGDTVLWQGAGVRPGVLQKKIKSEKIQVFQSKSMLTTLTGCRFSPPQTKVLLSIGSCGSQAPSTMTPGLLASRAWAMKPRKVAGKLP
mgnify:CR=1 FL=1